MSEPVDVTQPDGEFRHDAAERRNISPLVFVFGAGGLVLVVLLVMVTVMSSLDPPAPPASTAVAETKMPDGSVLAIEKVTATSPHNFAVEMHPEGFSPFRGSWTRNMIANGVNNGLVIWLTQRDPVTGRPMDLSWWSYCVVVDEHGCEIRDEQYLAGRHAYSYRGGSTGGGNRPFSPLGHGDYQRVIAYTALRPFRHSGKTFKLRFYDQADIMVAELDVPNPPRTPFPEWKPEPLPMTKSDGDVTVRLTDFRAQEHMGKEYQQHLRKMVDVKMVRIQPQFLVLQHGKPTGQWSRRGEELLDALGNQSSPRNCKLCFHESAWKYKLKLFRDQNAEYDSSELWAVRDLEIPKPGKKVEAHHADNIQGLVVEVLATGGGGSVSYQNISSNKNGSSSTSGGFKKVRYKIKDEARNGQGTTTVTCEHPHVVVRISHMTGDHLVTLQAADEQGRKVEMNGPHGSYGIQVYFFDPAEDVKKLNLAFTVQKCRKFEFLVKPPKVERLKLKTAPAEAAPKDQ